MEYIPAKSFIAHLANGKMCYKIFAEEEQRQNGREQATLCVACLREVKSVATRERGAATSQSRTCGTQCHVFELSDVWCDVVACLREVMSDNRVIADI